jgi:DNA-binding transcriptional ArsR family regulator
MKIGAMAEKGASSTSISSPMDNPGADNADAVFESVAELFGLLSTPVRLKIIGALCNGEKNVSQLLAQIDTTQPNMSQHLATLYRAGVLGKRRDSTQIYYRLQSERVASLCRAVCTQVAIELDGSDDVPNHERLLPGGGR